MPYHPPVASHTRFSRSCRFPRAPLSWVLLLATALPIFPFACSSGPGKKPAETASAKKNVSPDTSAPPAPVLWTLHSARRQSSFLRLDLPVVISGMRITLSAPAGPVPWINSRTDNFNLFTTHIARGEIAGPAVEQLTGFPQTSSDAGSYLVKLPIEKSAAVDADKTYTVTNPFPSTCRSRFRRSRIPATTSSPSPSPFPTAPSNTPRWPSTSPTSRSPPILASWPSPPPPPPTSHDFFPSPSAT